MSKSCWSCGHWLIGLGCCFSGIERYVKTAPEYSCDKWITEGAPGTVTDFEGLTDGDTWKDNEFLKDDESNL
ncbi:hypothetical protein AAGS61_05830 [Lysinibacillus sp. KU-BSD001]|uniref:hypothetical protein n=1 Tax=Lysinibacillus sp. KU-BSD001 TaxID=3141328 RepID=UPI0036F0149C